jgi:simple sugar transport system ATP-binding protein
MKNNSVEMKDISKSFDSNMVLRGVDLSVPAGKVTALLGANGAGKSTLIKILSGLYPDHGGQVLVNGKPVVLESPARAKSQGIQTVHQRVDEAVVPGLSVAENLLFEKIAAGAKGMSGSLRSLLPEARKVAAALSLDWSDRFLRKDVYELDIADQQLLTLARAVVDEPSLLVLDEPTSALSAAEVDTLMAVIRRLRDQGVGILYVSHRLSEVDAIADHLVVLRDGVIRGEQDKPFAWNDALSQMLGEDSRGESSASAEQRGTEELLAISGLKLFPRSEPFDLSIRSGEVTGVIGLLGSGKSEIAEAIFGVSKISPRSMTLDQRAYNPTHPARAIKRGVYLVPEDRARLSMFPEWSISQTVTLPFLEKVTKGMTINFAQEKEMGAEVIENLGVVAQGPEQSVDSLSGGNQQKVIVGRWLMGDPKILVLDEPFRGVDIGARRAISQKSRDLAASGRAVLVFTSEVDELFEVADRVIVLVDGVPRMDTYLSKTNREEIMNTMSEVA